MQVAEATIMDTAEHGSKDHFKRTLGFRALLAVAVGLVVSQGVMVIMLQF